MRKKKSIRKALSKIVGTVAVLGLLTAGTYVATASSVKDERFFAFGMSSTEFSIKPFSSEAHPNWNIALANAVEEWNDSNPAINITIDESSFNTVGFDSQLERRALYSKFCVPFVCKFHIAVKEEITDGDAEKILGEGQFLLVHEIGHALGLNDVYTTPNGETSVMAQKTNFRLRKPSIYDMQLVTSRISHEKQLEETSMLALGETNIQSFFSPIWRAFNGYQN